MGGNSSRSTNAYEDSEDARLRNDVIIEISIEHDQDGFYTILYDKRDKMHAQGVMGAIQRFPSHDAAMSQQVLYGVVTS